MLHGLFSSCSKWSYCIVARHRILIAEHGLSGLRASVVAAPGLQSTGSIVVAHGLCCSMACGIFQDQGLNPCVLHWQADSVLLSHKKVGSGLLIQYGVTSGFLTLNRALLRASVLFQWHRIPPVIHAFQSSYWNFTERYIEMCKISPSFSGLLFYLFLKKSRLSVSFLIAWHF